MITIPPGKLFRPFKRASTLFMSKWLVGSSKKKMCGPANISFSSSYEHTLYGNIAEGYTTLLSSRKKGNRFVEELVLQVEFAQHRLCSILRRLFSLLFVGLFERYLFFLLFNLNTVSIKLTESPNLLGDEREWGLLHRQLVHKVLGEFGNTKMSVKAYFSEGRCQIACQEFHQGRFTFVL